MELTSGITDEIKKGWEGLGSLDLSSQAIPRFSEQTRCSNITRLCTTVLISLVSLSALALGVIAITCGTLISLMSGAAVIAFALLGLAFAAIVLKRMFEAKKEEKPSEAPSSGGTPVTPQDIFETPSSGGAPVTSQDPIRVPADGQPAVLSPVFPTSASDAGNAGSGGEGTNSL